jgi:hypothetical protein
MVAGEDVMGLPSARGGRAGRLWSTCGRCGFIPNPARCSNVIMTAQQARLPDGAVPWAGQPGEFAAAGGVGDGRMASIA